MIDKRCSAEKAIERIVDGSTIMVGGSMALGAPEQLIDALVRKGVRNLTVICNDGGVPGRGTSKLIKAGLVSHLITTHVGLNPEVTEQCIEGKLKVTLIPQGTFAERIRAGAAGLGGILTPTGLGTVVEEGKQIIEVEGKRYLLEIPLRAEVALIRGSVVDDMGNIQYYGTTNNWNSLMAGAADFVAVTARKVVPRGQIDPHLVMTPGIFIDAIVEGEVPWDQVK